MGIDESQFVVGKVPRKRFHIKFGKRQFGVLIVVLILAVAGGIFGIGAYRKYQVDRAEKRYQSVLAQATSLNTQGKSKEVVTLLERYLASKPAVKYQSRPKYFLALAYLGTSKRDEANKLLEQIVNDPSISKGERKAVLAALISIAGAKNDVVAGEKYMLQMLAYLKEMSTKPENKQYGIYYATEIQRYDMILAGLRKQKK